MARVQTAAQQESFERNGFEEYEYICCGLPDACEICRALDGKIFKVKDMMVGENAPPMHPNCHCSTAAAAASCEDFDAWLDAKAAGETGLGFEEWDRFNKTVKDSASTNGMRNGTMKMNLQFFASGKDRVQNYGSGWGKASLQEVVDKFAPGATGTHNISKTKIIFNNNKSKRQIVYDIDGDYFRIENLERVGRRRYDDINGNDVSNVTENGKTRGRTREEYEAITHFLNKK